METIILIWQHFCPAARPRNRYARRRIPVAREPRRGESVPVRHGSPRPAAP